ncbi:MAG: NUDIX domain-containing protein [Clostridia bacterium]|nr:NUDIX domain-containing protein [Clostridia bacterium]
MENLDLTVNVGDYKLNVRAAGIVIHNHRVLFHKSPKNDYYALIGGRVKIGEDSVNTIKREIMEEMGKEIEIVKEFAYIENFFAMKGNKYHELMTVYQVEFVNENDKKIEDTLKCVEPNKELSFEWIDIDKLNEFDIRPRLIKEAFGKNLPVHIVNKEIS